MSLQVWLPLNGDLTNQGLSQLSGSWYASGVIDDNNGKIGKCKYFNKKYAQIDFPYTLGSEISCALWVNYTAFPPTDNNDWLFSLGTTSGYANALFAISTRFQDYLVSIVGGQYETNFKHNFSLNTWYHLAVTWDGTNIKTYINGELKRTYAAPSPSITTSTKLTLGANAIGTGLNINAKLNDFRIYDHALSAQEVKKLAQGLILHYPLNYHNINLLKLTGPERSCSSQSATILHYYYDFSGNLPSGTYTFSFDAKSSNGTDSCYVSYANGDSTINRIATLTNIPTKYTHYSYTFTNSASNCNNIFFTSYKSYGSPTNQNNTGTLYVRNIKLENGNDDTGWIYAASELSNTTVYDISGYKNHGTVVGSLTATAGGPRYGTATQFPGNAIIKKTDFIFNSNIWTVSLWYFKPTDPSAYEILFCLSQGDGSDSNKKICAAPNSGRIWYKGESGATSLKQITINAWCHLVMTCDGTTVKIYKDGNTTPISSFSASTALTGYTDLVIGARAAAEDATSVSVYYTGKLSDFRIYATALSADDVAELYALGSA